MNIQSVLEARRDGRGNTPAELAFVAEGAATGSIPDYQLSAWLMAAFLRPLNIEETVALTQAMAASGQRIDLTGLQKPWLDKHSTGGVGDKISIAVLPILSACGLTVVKMSGRGLGITGGTVDKLSSIPGFRLDLSPEELKVQAGRIGIAITGQTPDLAPADKALYALRDVTATVPSIPLIVSSILCKKLAGGAEIVVLDVKCGGGAFMKTHAEATELANALELIGSRCGLKVVCAITDMDQPLGRAIGNANEVREAIEFLARQSFVHDPAPVDPSRRFEALACELACEALAAAGFEDAPIRIEAAIETGAAFRKLAEWFRAQGATEPVWDDPMLLPQPRAVANAIHSDSAGWVAGVDAMAFGQAVVELGGGRHEKDDEIDPSVGIELGVAVGRRVDPGDKLFSVGARSMLEAEQTRDRLVSAITISPTPTDARKLVLDRVR